MAQNGLADGRDIHGAVGAFEEGHAQFFLQLLDLATQGRLADIAAIRRPAEVAGVGNRKDVFDVAQIHGEEVECWLSPAARGQG
jgi:hypothetical protein